MNEYLKANQAQWDESVSSHVKSALYDVPGFKAGRNTLRPIEREELGDVAGKSLLHLQCHFGMDTLSWARLGAKVTGVDFSNEAISAARTLSAEVGIDARFVHSNIYDLRDNLTGEFDIVFTSYGVLVWLPDMVEWAKTAAHFLKPGGTFLVVDGHPMSHMLEYNEQTGELDWEYDYFNKPQPYRFEGSDTYAAKDALVNNRVTYEWNHSLDEIVNSIIGAGLTIEHLHEFPVCGYENFPCMKKGKDGWWLLPEKYRDTPMLFSIKARKG